MPIFPAIELLYRVGRGAAAAPEAFKQEGVSGIFEALASPQTFEQSKRFREMREENQPILQSIEESLGGDHYEPAFHQMQRLQSKLLDEGKRPAEVNALTGSIARNIFARATAAGRPQQSLQAASILQPANTAQNLQAGAQLQQLPGQIALRSQQTEQARVQAQQLLPAAARAYQELGELRSRSPQIGGAGGDQTGRRQSALTQYDKGLTKLLESVNQNLVDPSALNAQLAVRNRIAAEAGMPQFELAEGVIPNPTAKEGEPPTLTQYGLRLMQQQGTQAPALAPFPEQQQPQPAPAPELPAYQGSEGQGRERFVAAVQAPLGVLSEQTRATLLQGGAVPETLIVQELAQQRFQPREVDEILRSLKTQVGVAQQGAGRPGPQPTPTPRF